MIRPSRATLVMVSWLAVLGTAFTAARAIAQPVAGFIEEWAGTSDQGWSGGGFTVSSNPGAGGVLGSGDGYLYVSSPTAGKLGVSSPGPAYFGNWLAAGIHSVKISLDDVNAQDALEIHFSFGETHTNFWQYNTGFHPPLHAWTEFVVDLDDSSRFTQIFGPGSFAGALQNVDRVHFRHDLAPYSQFPDDVTGDFGMDHFVLSAEVVPVRPLTWGRLKSLYR